MGGTASKIYRHTKRLVIRYNAENRAHKFLDKGDLPVAPRHPNSQRNEITLSREALEDIHCKNLQLGEFLKKVYLTSTSQIIGTPSKRPKPKKENEELKMYMFYEPKEPQPGFCTLTNVIRILYNYQTDSKDWNLEAVANNFKLNKRDIVSLLLYHSLFTVEKLEMFNQKASIKPEKMQFEVYNQLEKKPLKAIDSK